MTALELTDVWKGYPSWPAGGRTLRAVVARRAPLLVRSRTDSWALRGVSLSVQRGEAVGIIGANGAGKSTLLRLAAGLGRPTRGRVAVRGNVAAVLSLGGTLDPLLTGRENALTAALVAGFERRQARALVPRALAFAELDDVADAPVRTYSDGMKLRLAFGVVAQMEPEVLLLDEVLSVGDLAFQSRCMERMRELRERGTTLLFASHDLGQVASVCDSAVWLDAGAVRSSGAASEVLEGYQEGARARAIEMTPLAQGASGPLRLRENRLGTQALTIEEVVARQTSDGTLVVALRLLPHQPAIVDPIVTVAVHRQEDGLLCCRATSRDDGALLGPIADETWVQLDFDQPHLAPGEYRLDVGAYSSDWEETFDFHWRAHRLTIAGSRSTPAVVDPPRRWAAGVKAAHRESGLGVD